MTGIEEIKVDSTFIKLMDELRQPDKSVGLIEAGRKNIIVFAERMLGLQPPGIIKPKGKNKYGHIYSWQVFTLRMIQQSLEARINPKVVIKTYGGETSGHIKLLIDDREFVVITSRQIGKSVMLSILSLWCTIYNVIPSGAYYNSNVLIVSASDVQAKKLLYEMKKMIAVGDKYMAMTYLEEDGTTPMFGESFFTSMLSTDDPNNTTTISFVEHRPDVHGEIILAQSKYGSSIKSYPPTSSVLGETAGLVIIDEAGMTERITDQFFYDYLYPVGNSTDAIRVYTSTPWLVSGFFYRLVNPDGIYVDTPSQVYCFTIDAIKIENPTYHERIMKIVKQMLDDGKKNEVQRAYYCRFVKGESSYFNPEDIYPVFEKGLGMKTSFAEPCDLGVDFGGQVKSKTVLTVSYLDSENISRRLYHRTYEVGKDTEMLRDIAELKTKFNIQRIIVDDCPAGAPYIIKMKEAGWDVQLMNFRSEKVKKYGAFRVALKRGKIKSYEDDNLKTEMLALEFTPGSRQSNIQHAPGYSDDLLDSFLMSCYFYLDDEQKVEFFQW